MNPVKKRGPQKWCLERPKALTNSCCQNFNQIFSHLVMSLNSNLPETEFFLASLLHHGAYSPPFTHPLHSLLRRKSFFFLLNFSLLSRQKPFLTPSRPTHDHANIGTIKWPLQLSAKKKKKKKLCSKNLTGR